MLFFREKEHSECSGTPSPPFREHWECSPWPPEGLPEALRVLSIASRGPFPSTGSAPPRPPRPSGNHSGCWTTYPLNPQEVTCGEVGAGGDGHGHEHGHGHGHGHVHEHGDEHGDAVFPLNFPFGGGSPQVRGG